MMLGDRVNFVMGAMVPFIDIIIFAVIAVLLVIRLRSVLGQRLAMSSLRVSVLQIVLMVMKMRVR